MSKPNETPVSYARPVRVSCPQCGSDDVVCDASASWNEEKHEWELSGVQDCMTCQDCDAEFNQATESNPESPVHDWPLVNALYWFIENVSEDNPLRTDYFFALRERVKSTFRDYGTLTENGINKAGAKALRAFVDSIIVD